MRRRAFTPDRPAHEAPRLPLGPMPTSGWSQNPRDHITIVKPTCGAAPRCREPAMAWQRCRCGETFARCHRHEPDQVAALRAAHRCP